jgi:hypothetical protein
MSAEQPLLTGAVPAPASVDPKQGKRNATIDLVETFLGGTFAQAELLLQRPEQIPVVNAVRPIYFAVYNVCLEAGLLLALEISDLLERKAQARNGVRLPHSNTAIVAARLVTLTDPPAKSGERSPAAQAAFSLCRQLQKYRRVADYMGCEKLSPALAQSLVQQGKDLATKIWRYARENCD